MGIGGRAALRPGPADDDTWVWIILWYPFLVKMLIVLEKNYFQGKYPVVATVTTTGS